MIKKFLLWIAYRINEHYQTIEIKPEDIIKYKNNYYGIVKAKVIEEKDCIDTLEITAYDVVYRQID